MNIETSGTHYMPLPAPATQEVCTWSRVWHELPPQGVVVPVWDGDYLYYASYWQREGNQFWSIADVIISEDGDMDMRKKAGEQVFPIQWMKIKPPTS